MILLLLVATVCAVCVFTLRMRCVESHLPFRIYGRSYAQIDIDQIMPAQTVCARDLANSWRVAGCVLPFGRKHVEGAFGQNNRKTIYHSGNSSIASCAMTIILIGLLFLFSFIFSFLLFYAIAAQRAEERALHRECHHL